VCKKRKTGKEKDEEHEGKGREKLRGMDLTQRNSYQLICQDLKEYKINKSLRTLIIITLTYEK
jgi:hypothetical protein